MKILNQSIPSELATEYKKLVVNKPADASGNIITRTTKKTHLPAPTRPPRKELRDYENAVDFLIEYLTKKDGHPPPKTFKAAQVAKLKRGTFDTEYWAQCATDSTAILINAPTSSEWSGARAYAYPDENNQPSIPVYGAGTPTTGSLNYSGATAADTFTDLSLTWRRVIYTLKNKFLPSSKEPIFLKITGSISATANSRAARAMLSVIVKRWLVKAASVKLTTTESPVIEPISAYYRYITPRGEAPYFQYTHPLRLIYTMRSPDYEESGGDLEKCVILLAPMPMMGKRYNNNTSISTTLTAITELWQIKKSATGFYLAGWIIHPDGTKSATVNLAANWLYFRTENAGLAEIHNGTTGLNDYFLISGKLQKTAYLAPWQADPDWDTTGYVTNVILHTDGYMVGTNVSGNWFMDYWIISTTGALINHYDDTTEPDLWNLLGGNPDETPWISSINKYGFNEGPYTGERFCDIFTPMGVMTDQIDYSDAAAPINSVAFASDTHIYNAVRVTHSGNNWFQIWQIDTSPAVMLGEVPNDENYIPKVAYHAGIFYIFKTQGTYPSHTMTEAGVIAEIGIVGTISASQVIPTTIPWITG